MTDLLFFLALCFVSVVVGLGLIRLLGLEPLCRQSLGLAPGVTLALWAWALGLGVTLRVPVRQFAPGLWLVSGVLALIGARALWGRRDGIRWSGARAWGRGLAPVLLGVLLPGVMLSAHFRAGLTGFANVLVGDGWSYVADAQYLWEQRRGVADGLSVLHTYASHLAGTRHVAAALMDFLACLGAPGDPQAAVGLLVAWGLFVYACACAVLGEALFGGTRLLAYMLSSVPVGGVAFAVGLSNYDHALFLALLPLLLASTRLLVPAAGRIALLGLLASASLYTYPEMLPLMGADVLIVAAWRWRQRRALQAVPALGAVAVAGLLTLPYLGQLWHFVTAQAAEYSKTTHGGWTFPGLLQPSVLPSALWGLGGESYWEPATQTTVAIVFTLLALLGLRRAWRRRPDLVLVAVLHLAGALWMLGMRSYTYAAYKLLSIGAWAFGLLLTFGAASVARRVRGVPRRLLFWALIAGCVAATLNSGGVRWLRRRETEGGFTVADFRALAEAQRVIGPSAVAVNVEQPAAQMWSTYFLRDVPLRVLDYRGYLGMPHLTRRMQRAHFPDWAEVRYVLTDTGREPLLRAKTLELAWQSPPYRLWRLRGDVALLRIEGASPVRSADAHSEIRVEPSPARLRLAILARRAGRLWLRAELVPPPDAARGTGRRLVASTLGESVGADADQPQLALGLFVAQGPNEVTLEARDAIGVRGLRLTLECGACERDALTAPADPADVP